MTGFFVSLQEKFLQKNLTVIFLVFSKHAILESPVTGTDFDGFLLHFPQPCRLVFAKRK